MAGRTPSLFQQIADGKSWVLEATEESEQQEQNVDASEEDAVTVHENDFDGDVEFETEASTDELMTQLKAIKEDQEEDRYCRL